MCTVMTKLRTALIHRLAIRSPGQAIKGPTMQEYYQSLDEAFRAGFEAGRLNTEIHEARIWIAHTVRE